MSPVVTIIVAVVGSSALTSFVQFLINRRDDKKSRLNTLEKQLKKLETDSVRLQLLVLMALEPQEKQEILKVAEHYFHELKGNWYMTPIFNKWLVNNNVAKPEWLSTETNIK